MYYYNFTLYPAALMKALMPLSDEEAGRHVKAFAIALTTNDTSTMPDGNLKELADEMLAKARQRSDTYRANRARREQKRLQKPSEEANPSTTTTDEEKALETQGNRPITETAKPKNPKEPKHPLFGSRVVFVTDKEEEDLKERFGQDLPWMVDILGNYKEATGKKYKSDAAALRGWVSEKVKENRSRHQSKQSFAEQERQRMGDNAASLLTEEQMQFYGLMNRRDYDG